MAQRYNCERQKKDDPELISDPREVLADAQIRKEGGRQS